jgi:glycosyltransferase involved in cell wall biosynthesis
VKIAFIVQRYGAEVLGGSEHLCRLVAERLAVQHEVDVLTTCARDYVTWKNEYLEGEDRVCGVTVRRFATDRERDNDAFNAYSDWIYNNSHTREDELEWLRQQGPWCPSLIEFLKRHHQRYDVLVFFTYLYSLTVLGLEVAPSKSVLVSTAHDEPAIQLDVFRDVFRRPAAICFLTQSEQSFVHAQFRDLPPLEDVVGVGVDLPPPKPYPRMPAPEDDGAADEAGEPAARDFPSHLTGRGVVFRRRHRLEGPIVLYGGRIDPGKGCEELIEYFSRYVEGGGRATLVLMGVKMMPLPEVPYVRFAGLLSDQERLQAMEAATVVVCPSPYESLSLLALEAMSVGTPVLANARSAVLVEHCLRSNGGLFYAGQDEFLECLTLLVGDARLRAALGANGREYIRHHYRWDVVLGKYERLFAKARGR